MPNVNMLISASETTCSYKQLFLDLIWKLDAEINPLASMDSTAIARRAKGITIEARLAEAERIRTSLKEHLRAHCADHGC